MRSPAAIGVAGQRVRVHELRERGELEHAAAEELWSQRGFEVAQLPRQKARTPRTMRGPHAGRCGLRMGSNARPHNLSAGDQWANSRHDEVSRYHVNLLSEKGVEES